MYIDKTYPFEPIKLDYDFTLLDNCLGCDNLSTHYNLIYLQDVNKLNLLLSKYPSLQSVSLDELIFNSYSIKIEQKDEFINLINSVYNHHVFFSSISPYIYQLSNSKIGQGIKESFGSIDTFYKQFTSTALSLYGSGYVYLVCNNHGKVSLFVTKNQETPIPYNLYPLIAIDLWEHSYYLKFKTDKEKYIKNFLTIINWPKINSNYIECEKCVNMSN